MAALLFVAPPGCEPDPPDTFSLLSHTIETGLGASAAIAGSAEADLVVLDGRYSLTWAKSTCQAFSSAQLDVPVMVLVTDAELPVITPEWGFSSFVLDTAQPAELDARIRFVLYRPYASAILTGGPIEIDEAGYSATIDGSPLDLTYTEFELLKYLVRNPGRVLTRENLLSEVWGYDYYGGTRTVDVHIRRLRAKLGAHELCIATVRNVGYRFNPR